MKKIFIIAIAACAMYSCGKKQQEAKADIDEFSSIAQNVDKAHNAQNSLDYEGTYIGTIPSASGEGIDVKTVRQKPTEPIHGIKTEVQSH